ncbi:hypothetical protein RvY_14014 [Ramazzottius varieornatus]|uniref:Uncharacterized protein n=1 Tax=Ramazzottius varieornatus TaxID=947166 RepID=A0A1D1VV08_RAMVA|nr:hypothetical protein RvY_14014 [Ramazzottius varieornatus]
MSPLQPIRAKPASSQLQLGLSAPFVEATGKRNPKPRGPQFRWANTAAQDYLLQWIEERGNWAKWRCAGAKTAAGQKKTCKDTTMAVLPSIMDYLKANGIDNVSVDSVKSKLMSFESSYRDSRALFATTVEGETEHDIQQKIITLKDKVEKACPFRSRLHPVFRDSLKMVTPYVADNTDATEDAEKFLMSNGQEMEANLLDLDVPSMVVDMFADQPTSPEASVAREVPAAQPGASPSNKKPVTVPQNSSSSSDGDSKADAGCGKRKKTKPKVPLALSGNKKSFSTRRKFLSYDEVMATRAGSWIWKPRRSKYPAGKCWHCKRQLNISTQNA